MPISNIAATALLISSIANKLSKLNTGSLPEGGQPSVFDLEDGIFKLIEEGLLTFNAIELSTPEEASDRLLGHVADAVKKLQKSTPILILDGIFGNQTLNFLRLPSCLGERPFRSIPGIDVNAESIHPQPGSTERPLIRFFIESAPRLTNSDEEEHVSAGWDAWTELINLDAQRTLDASEANVIIRTEPLDGPGSKLADADGGPLGNQLKEVRFDKTESWTADKLLYAAIHEYGHILGLHHSDTPGNIMYKRYQPDFIGVGRRDETEIKNIWGAR